MKTILVLTDFSERAAAAAEYAALLAVEAKADLILCHVSEVTAHLADGLEFTWPIADYLKLKNDSIEKLKHLSAVLKNIIPTDGYIPSIRLSTDFGLLPEVASAIIADNACSLVVIGQHAAGGLSRLLFGSHTYALLDKIDVPVLLVPMANAFMGLRNIAYANDRTFDDGKVINYLADIAKPSGAKISVIHFTKLEVELAEPGSACCVNVATENAGSALNVSYTSIVADDVPGNLMKLMANSDLDMLALVHKRYSFFDGLFHSSISKRIADHAQVPLLILPYSFSVNVADITNEQLETYCYRGNGSR